MKKPGSPWFLSPQAAMKTCTYSVMDINLCLRKPSGHQRLRTQTQINPLQCKACENDPETLPSSLGQRLFKTDWGKLWCGTADQNVEFFVFGNREYHILLMNEETHSDGSRSACTSGNISAETYTVKVNTSSHLLFFREDLAFYFIFYQVNAKPH